MSRPKDSFVIEEMQAVVAEADFVRVKGAFEPLSKDTVRVILKNESGKQFVIEAKIPGVA